MDKLLPIIKEIRRLAKDKGVIPIADQGNAVGLNKNYEGLNSFLNPVSDNNLTVFLKNEVQILLGLYVFIDPNKLHRSKTSDQMPFYLWGNDFFKDKSVKPSFELPTFINVPDSTSKVSFNKPDNCFKEFIQTINEHYRQSQLFQFQDFVIHFSKGHIEVKRNPVEKELDIFYVPSGEIDHCIHQLLSLYFVKHLNIANPTLASEVSIDLCKLTDEKRLLEYWQEINSNESQLKSKLNEVLTFANGKEKSLTIKVNGGSSNKKKIADWFKDWGYLNSEGKPTEKLIACLEYFYFLLKKSPTDTYHDLKNYLELFDNDLKATHRYFETATANTNKFINDFDSIIGKSINDSSINWEEIINQYLTVLTEWCEAEKYDPTNAKFDEFTSKRINWSIRGRVRTFIHFLNRSFHGYFSNGKTEESCRGVIFFPILNMPNGLRDSEENPVTYAGFFMCNLKDSDEVGKNFFNWFTQLDGTENPTAKEFYNFTIPQLQIFANVLGKIETEEIFFNGIIGESLKEQKEQATSAAISQVMARNMSHNIGSHVLIKIASNYDIGGGQYRPLIEFIQKRMEFIANGTFASFQSTYSLVDDMLSIYLENNKRIELLIENISGNENIKSENIEFELESSCSGNKYPVNVPNGTLGFQALHILIENIIRNSVKHNTKYPETTINGKPEIRLKYTIKVEEDKDFKDYYKVSVTDNFASYNEKIDITDLKRKLDEEILLHGSLRKGSWGLLEMKICAAYLCGIPIKHIDQANDRTKPSIPVNGIMQVFPPALEITKEDKTHNLIHTFYLQKPKIAALTNDAFEEDEANGIELVTDREAFNKGGSKHQFAVFQTETEAKQHQEKTNQTSVFLNEIISANKIKLEEEKLWELYGNQNELELCNVEIVFKNKEFSPVENTKYILFDSHNDWLENSNNATENKNLLDSKPSPILYYEFVHGDSPTNELFKSTSLNTTQRVKILETAFTKVIVLDERIQKNLKDDLKTDNYKNPKYSNLFIPPLEAKTILDKPDNAAIIEWANTNKNFRENRRLNYLIVHRSLIGEGKLIIKKLQEELKPEFTIFVSGGGTPPNLSEGEYYLPFDVLNSCIGAKPCKYALVSVLKSLRKNISK